MANPPSHVKLRKKFAGSFMSSRPPRLFRWMSLHSHNHLLALNYSGRQYGQAMLAAV